jgi:hypothetical protein
MVCFDGTGMSDGYLLTAKWGELTSSSISADRLLFLSSIGGLALRFHWMESAQLERF